MIVAGLGAPGRAAPTPRPVQVNPDEPVLVIDLRPPAAQDRDASRARFANELDGVYGLRTQRADGMDAALAGGDSGDEARALAALAEARTAYGALDCTHAGPAADRAALGFAARQAAGLPDDANARAAWAYVLLCADAGGDRDAAARAAGHLRVLGAASGETVGIPAATWDRYPDIDAHVGRDLVELVVRAPDNDGADVYIDLVRIGPAPATAVVPAGAHVIAVGIAAPGTRRAAVRVTATKSTALDVALVDEGTPYDDVAAKVRAWRATPPTALEMSAILDRLHAHVALVLVGQGAVATWIKGPRDDHARQVADGSLDEPLPIGALINARIAAWGGRGEDPDVPLLRENHEDDTRPHRDHWWVYASLVGAVAIGAAAVYAHDSARDHQRIELVFP
ncbi:MAG: hypothetical protein K8W52_16500 [Deltaproteobacteria bacterium]|nr:hypothetical protein [Deltaproteobacteria bacterium]